MQRGRDSVPAVPVGETSDEPLSRDEAGFLTPSNLISLSRVPLGVSFLFVNDPRWLGAIVFAGGLSDLLDGLIARWTGKVSRVGLLLDPLCDKLFVLLGLVSFVMGPHLDWAAFLILILRDIFTAGTYLLGRAVGRVIPFRPRMPGKVATFLQLVTLLALIFWTAYVPLLVLAVGIVSVYSIVDYGMSALREEQRRAVSGRGGPPRPSSLRP